MNKVSLRIAVRQLLASAESKIYTYHNEAIISAYKEHVAALRLTIEAGTYNRAERAKLLRLLVTCCPLTFEQCCYHDAEMLRKRLNEIKRTIPSLI